MNSVTYWHEMTLILFIIIIMVLIKHSEYSVILHEKRNWEMKSENNISNMYINVNILFMCVWSEIAEYSKMLLIFHIWQSFVNWTIWAYMYMNMMYACEMNMNIFYRVNIKWIRVCVMTGRVIYIHTNWLVLCFQHCSLHYYI